MSRGFFVICVTHQKQFDWVKNLLKFRICCWIQQLSMTTLIPWYLKETFAKRILAELFIGILEEFVKNSAAVYFSLKIQMS